jgi:hypothetical protein
VNCGAPDNTLDPISQALLSYEPLPNVPGAGNVNNYLGILPNSFYKDSGQSAHRFYGEPEFNCTNHPNFGDPNITLTANAISSSTLQPIPRTEPSGQSAAPEPEFLCENCSLLSSSIFELPAAA